MAVTAWFSAPSLAPAVLFPFISAQGAIDGVQMSFDEIIRPGVDGVGVYLTGRRGESFQMDTICDFSSMANALAQYASYASRTGSTLKLYRYGSLLGTVLVQRVQQTSILPARSAIGGNNISAGGNGYLLAASWRLRGI